MEELKASDFNNLKINRDILPYNIKDSFRPLDRKLEKICADVHFFIKSFFNEKNKFEYALLVVKVMEFLEDIKQIKSFDKKTIAVRCIAEYILENKNIDDDTKGDLLRIIPSSIETIINFSKTKKINTSASKVEIIESAYVTKRSIERIIEFIRKKKYNGSGFVENIFLIISQTMFIVGGYSSLSNKQKKEITIQVIKTVINEFNKKTLNNKISEHYINTLDTYLPNIIDVLYSVNNRKYNINNLSKCFDLFSCCFIH